MRKRLACLAGVALLVAACGGGSGAPPSAPSNTPPATTPPPGGGTNTASIAIPASDGYGNSTFAPGSLTVAPGTSVTWSNHDSVTHTSASGSLWSATMPPGESFSRTFSERGTFSYRCTIHPGMNGTITVQ